MDVHRIGGDSSQPGRVCLAVALALNIYLASAYLVFSVTDLHARIDVLLGDSSRLIRNAERCHTICNRAAIPGLYRNKCKRSTPLRPVFGCLQHIAYYAT